MTTLGELVSSEFNLLGSVGADQMQLIYENASEEEKRMFLRSVQQTVRQRSSSGGKGSRGELEKRLHMLPADILVGLGRQQLQAVDAAFYVVKNISGSKVQRILKDDDTKVVGVSNLSSAKLEKGNHFLLYGISLLAGVAGPGETAASVNFAVIPDYLRNGEFEFMANSTSLIPNASCEVFNTTGQTIPTGFYELHNPKLVRDQQAMEFNLEWGTNAPEHTYIKAILHGTMITKA